MTVRAYEVTIKETYADGYVYENSVHFSGNNPNVAIRRALAWDQRGKLTGHGPAVRLEVKAE